MKTSKMLRVLTSVLLLFGFTQSAFAMDGSINGIVVDELDDPISRVTVRASDLVDGSKVYTARTDEYGRFSIDGVSLGSYLVGAETINTNWVQKNQSPIVAISESGGASSASVRLVLVQLSQLQGSSGGGDGANTIGIATLAVAGTALGFGIASWSNSKDAKDASEVNSGLIQLNNDEILRNRAAIDRNSQQLGDVQRSLDNQQRQLNDIDDQLDSIDQQLGWLFNNQAQILRDLGGLQQEVDRIASSVFN